MLLWAKCSRKEEGQISSLDLQASPQVKSLINKWCRMATPRSKLAFILRTLFIVTVAVIIIIVIKSECTRDGRSLLDELSSARLQFWRNSHQRCAWAQNKIWRPPFGPSGPFGWPRGLQSGHFLNFKNPVFWSYFLYLKPHRYVS